MVVSLMGPLRSRRLWQSYTSRDLLCAGPHTPAPGGYSLYPEMSPASVVSSANSGGDVEEEVEGAEHGALSGAGADTGS